MFHVKQSAVGKGAGAGAAWVIRPHCFCFKFLFFPSLAAKNADATPIKPRKDWMAFFSDALPKLLVSFGARERVIV